MGEQPIRRCRWCRLVLDVNAPANSELVTANVDGKRQRRVRPHCPSPVCDWCLGDYRRRFERIKAGLNPDTGDPPEVEPDRMV